MGDVKSIATDVCAICLSPPTVPCRVDAICRHIYCQACLDQWAEIRLQAGDVVVCPKCKYPCPGYFRVDTNAATVFRPPDPKKDEDGEAEEDDGVCEICHSGADEHKLLICDGCMKHYHTDCLTPPLREVPMDSWHCSECEHDAEEWTPNDDDRKDPLHGYGDQTGVVVPDDVIIYDSDYDPDSSDDETLPRRREKKRKMQTRTPHSSPISKRLRSSVGK